MFIINTHRGTHPHTSRGTLIVCALCYATTCYCYLYFIKEVARTRTAYNYNVQNIHHPPPRSHAQTCARVRWPGEGAKRVRVERTAAI